MVFGKNNIITALDVGTSKVSTVVAEKMRGSDKLRILGAGLAASRGIRKGTVTDMKDAIESIRDSVTEAARSAGVPIRSVWLGVGGAGVTVSSSRGVVAVARADGEITRDDVQRAIAAAESFVPKNPNKEILATIPRDYKVDNESGIKEPVGLSGVRLEVDALIIGYSSLFLRNLLKCVEAAGLRADNLIFSPLASAEAVLTRRQRELGVLLLDIGGGTSSFIVFEEGAPVHAGVFPLGGSQITNDIAIGFKTHIDIAEAVKCRFGKCVPDQASKKEYIKLADFVPPELKKTILNNKNRSSREDQLGVFSQKELAEIVEARLRDIFELVAKELKKIGKWQLLPSGVVLVGGSSLIPGIVELAKKELQLPVEEGAPLDFTEDMIIDANAMSSLAVCLGILKLASKEVPDKNFKLTGFSGSLGYTLKKWFRYLLP